MTDKEYNDLKEFERQYNVFKLQTEPHMYLVEQVNKKWYKQKSEEYIKAKELKEHGWNFSFPPII